MFHVKQFVKTSLFGTTDMLVGVEKY
jgi:hypothetical protein